MSKNAEISARSPRHYPGSIELKEGTGPITAMCPCGSFLEIFKVDRTFRIQTPESVDPEETNPNAPWVSTPVSNYGSANLTVARVLLQSKEMLSSASFDGTVDKEAVLQHMHSCKEVLLACETLSDRVTSGISKLTNQIEERGIPRDNGGRGFNPFPHVEGLELDCGAFLVQINRAVKLVCELPTLFFDLERPDSNFDHLATRLAKHVGEDTPLTRFVRAHADRVRYIAELRNYHEHPREIRTVIKNFHALPSGDICEPTWQMVGEPGSQAMSVKEEIVAATEFVRSLAEVLFLHLLMHQLVDDFPFIVTEIEESERDSAVPIRYRLALDFSQIHVSSAPYG
ncbi:hypothetical protein [Luteimonas terrae]|uniref:Uncharacterized protein n=1 Tax=Luteimonas terrae TaxID=1530191 RepID=A0A4R5U902_9GAMM|nr:hypothetical protein [Luteimonas terrae]TDK30979.1 hypothetical protein E2F49_11630 [Luteimonas terrae]